MSNKNTQFKRTPEGEKTDLMRKVEGRIGRPLEEDYVEFYQPGVKGHGQKALADRWRVTRQQIFGPVAPGRRTWVEMLNLTLKDGAGAKEQFRRASRRCEICGTDDVALENAHWIPRCNGGSTRADNILKLCPNCHTRLDRDDAAIAKRAPEVLLIRAAEAMLQSTNMRDGPVQRRFYDLCVSILQGRITAPSSCCSDRPRPVSSCKPNGVRRLGVEAAGPALSGWPLEALAQGEEPPASGDGARDRCVEVRTQVVTAGFLRSCT
jgi:hypothetical protein